MTSSEGRAVGGESRLDAASPGGPGKDGAGLVPRPHDPFILTSAEFQGTGYIEPRLGVKRSTQLKESAYDPLIECGGERAKRPRRTLYAVT
jgi:hypothetical protein